MEIENTAKVCSFAKADSLTVKETNTPNYLNIHEINAIDLVILTENRCRVWVGDTLDVHDTHQEKKK